MMWPWTDQDEVNILACAIAQQAGVAFKIARVANHDFIRPAYFDLQKIGVDLVINQKEECANELFNILRMPGAIEVVDMLDGQVYAVGMPVHMDSPLLRGLKAFPEASG
jgi:trk system potassium uptake protein TrkA